MILLCACVSVAYAADHLDPPDSFTVAGDAADIGDLYAWHSGSGADQVLTVVLTHGGPLLPSESVTYDPDVLYTIAIDTDADHIANTEIFIRFAQNDLGEWGVQVTGLPGATGQMVGAIETTITNGDVCKAFAGLRDDPFFFDLEGFNQTLDTGALAFDPNRDFFAGANISAIVLEMPMSAALGISNSLSIWATTSRIGD